MADRALLAFGQFRRRKQIELSVMADEAALGLKLTSSLEEALSWLERSAPHALLIDDSSEHGEALCLETRSHASRARTPIISLAHELDDLSFAEVFNWGGDDAVQTSSMRPLLSRVRLLPREGIAAPSEARGTAVVADPDRDRRVIRARVLNNAGFSIRFALTTDDALQFAGDTENGLVLVDVELDGALDLVVTSAERNPRLTHVMLCAPRKLHEMSKAVKQFRNVALADGFAPPENVVFLANELSRGGSNENRASRRLLYGTRVAFRGEGRDTDDYGFSYNVSAGGLYVRTLAPPNDDRVWLELRPPRTDKLVRVEGEVVWRRHFGPTGGATVPPGFGVRLADATRASMAAWLEGYNEFNRALGLAE